MANDKDLPAWAVVGADVLYTTYSGEPTPAKIQRVTKTSAFIGDRRFVVRSKWDRNKDALEEYGYRDTWHSGPTIRPLHGEEAKAILRKRADKAKARAVRDSLGAAIKLFPMGSYWQPDFEAEIKGLNELQQVIGEYVLHAERRAAQENSEKTSGGKI